MRIFVLGVNGLTGRAIAADLADAGHDVVGTGRAPERFPDGLAERGVAFERSDRTDPAGLASTLRGGADVVVDCAGYTAQHARALVAAAGDSVGSIVALSSKAVYVDSQRRHSNSDEAPDFGAPVPESCAVLDPDFSGEYDSREGYGPNKVAMEMALREAGVPVTILRPSRIHGPGAARPREWWVVSRLLRGQRRFPLVDGGRTGNHPTAAANLATLVRTCAEHPGARVLNAAGTYEETVAATVDELIQLDSARRRALDEDPYFAG